MQPKIKLDPKLKAILQESGRNWEVRNGGSHAKLYIEGTMVTVLPRQDKNEARGNLNTRAQVRRHLARLDQLYLASPEATRQGFKLAGRRYE